MCAKAEIYYSVNQRCAVKYILMALLERGKNELGASRKQCRTGQKLILSSSA